MQKKSSKKAIVAPFHFRIGPAYINYWMHQFQHWDSSQAQLHTVADVDETLKLLLKKRDELQSARGVFGRVSVYYPKAGPTQRQQQALFSATQDFFQTYYAAVSSLMSLIKRHSQEFGDAPTRSVARFLKWWKPTGLFMEDAYPILESARAFRAMLDHKESNPPYTWEAINDGPLTKIRLNGSANANGQLPDGTHSHQGGWAFLAPDEDLVTSALAVQLNSIIQRISAKTDLSRSLRCVWASTPTVDDVHAEFPIFASRDGVVGDIFDREISTQVKVTRRSSGVE